MQLSPELVNRLVAIRSLLDLGDIELVSVAASRLDGHRGEPEIDEILSALDDCRYADAAQRIGRLLSDGTRLARWQDPEIALLEAELERITAEFADAEAEHAELEHSVARFQAVHHEMLGERIARLLQLRMRLLERKLRSHPEERQAFEDVSRDFEEFQRDQEVQKESSERTRWDLTEDEQVELKRLFRQGSKRCHPDLVPPEYQAAAAQMFRELRAAYDEGNLERLRKLAERAEAGLFESLGDATEDDVRLKKRLRARIAGIREALANIRASLEAILTSSTYLTMTGHEDWESLFTEQSLMLDREIGNLTTSLEERDAAA